MAGHPLSDLDLVDACGIGRFRKLLRLRQYVWCP
jgi:hypothetical protein